MRTVEFRRLFDGQNAARVQFETERNRVLEFMVQLECLFGDDWYPNEALTFAIQDLTVN